ncbi:MAG: hypothetical protein ACYC6W_04790 [Nitrosotalea sp.]
MAQEFENFVNRSYNSEPKYPGIDRVLSSDFISNKKKILHSGNGW